MSGIVVLALRALLAASLYAFLVVILVTLWRDVRQQAVLINSRQTPPLTISVSTGNLLPQIRHFTRPEVTIGRNPDSECPLEDDSVSSYHARLNYHHGQWWLQDLGSTNGTLLNNEKLAVATIIISGDVIRCGESLLEVISAGTMPAPMPRRLSP